MPNTLVHLGVQGAVCRALCPQADPKWVWAGCIVPDAAWILQRIAGLVPGVPAYELRLYAVVQASLGFSLLLAVAVTAFSGKWGPAALIVGANALFHLLLDACQIKWAFFMSCPL